LCRLSTQKQKTRFVDRPQKAMVCPTVAIES
jgi:hypothetical protein